MANDFFRDIPKLGFGMMRLPMLPFGGIDEEQTKKMVDLFIENGFTYFDTAFGYLNGKSEEVAGRALVARYPRDAFQLATKLPPWELKEPSDMERVFSTQLARTGAGYFDFYMLHSLGRANIERMDQLGGWAFIQQKKAEGLVRHIGISFHDSADVLDKTLTDHPELEFVQLQINYADWEDADVQSRLCYETVRRHGRAVIVMEPVKGGALATLAGEAKDVLEAARPGKSIASWAMRYAASLDGLVTVLSGMSTTQQMLDNIDTMKHAEPLTQADEEALAKVLKILTETPTIPCTGCNYCTEKCPQNIPIPAILRSENDRRRYGEANKGHYAFITRGKGRASDCIACGVCEGRCPQHIEIIERLGECVAAFE